MFQRSNPPPPEPKTNKPQFPDLLFTDRGVECEGEAEHRDDAIRASFIWFKHQWPGVTAEIVDATDGVYATMVAIAAQVGVPVKRGRSRAGRGVVSGEI